jgi:hypothetical protein
MLSTIVRIDRNVRGAWDVVSDQGEHLTCKTLDEAQSIAKELAARVSEFGGLSTTVRIDRNVRGAWDVVSDQGDHLSCRTLDEAQRVAERFAAGIRPCETLIRDAYHRVVHLDLSGGDGRDHSQPPRKRAPLTRSVSHHPGSRPSRVRERRQP